MKAGDFIKLKDEETIRDQIEKGLPAEGLECTVERVRRFYHKALGCSWTIVELKDQNLLLIVKEVDGLKDYRIYFKPDNFTPGDRKDLIENGCQWIFNEPEEGFEYNQLTFAETMEDDGVLFKIKGGSFADDFNDDLFMITEWSTDEPDYGNPELLALELGGSESETGGYITFWQGANVHKTDIEFLNGE